MLFCCVWAYFTSRPVVCSTCGFSHTDLSFAFLRPWRVRSMCSKMSYRDHVQDTSSWPISLHACVSAWMCIWRLRDRTTVWRGPASSPAKRCVYALSGEDSHREDYYTHWMDDTVDIELTSLCFWISGVQIVWSRSSTTILRASLVIVKPVHMILPLTPLSSPLWLFVTQLSLFRNVFTSLKIKEHFVIFLNGCVSGHFTGHLYLGFVVRCKFSSFIPLPPCLPSPLSAALFIGCLHWLIIMPPWFNAGASWVISTENHVCGVG